MGFVLWIVLPSCTLFHVTVAVSQMTLGCRLMTCLALQSVRFRPLCGRGQATHVSHISPLLFLLSAHMAAWRRLDSNPVWFDRDYCAFITFLTLWVIEEEVARRMEPSAFSGPHMKTRIKGAIRPSPSVLTVQTPQQWNNISAFRRQFAACTGQLPVSLFLCTSWRCALFVVLSLPHIVTLVL